MGSGKSTVGKALARKIKHPFYDADHEIENRCGVDIPTIFEFEGEAGFREREKRILTELTALEPIVLATGGGAILKRGNRKLLRDNGHVILLSVTIEEQLRRVSLNKNRPLLQGGDVENKLRTLMQERRELYEKTAHHVVQTDSSRMQTVVNGIMRHLTEAGMVDVVETRSSTTTSRSKKSPRAGKKTRSRNTAAKTPSNTSRRTQQATSKTTEKNRKTGATAPGNTRTRSAKTDKQSTKRNEQSTEKKSRQTSQTKRKPETHR